MFCAECVDERFANGLDFLSAVCCLIQLSWAG
jgi:hypothetical protein